MEQEFDKQIKNKVAGEQIKPSADLWDRIEGKLNAFEKPIEVQTDTTTKKLPMWKYAAAAAVVGIAATFGFAFLNQTNNQSFAGNTLPDVVLKQDIQIGEQLNPSVNVINVAEVNTAPMPKTPKAKKATKVMEVESVADNTVLAADETISSDDNAGIPVFSLKLNAPKTSASLNDKIKVLSGEPVNVKVDEELNTKQILIHQRLKLSNEYNRTLRNSKKELP